MSSALDMRHSSSSSFSSTSTSLSFTKSKRRRWSREELLRNLSILGPLSAPPAPELPPSPPASRSSSPVPGTKRKASAIDSDHNKRPRVSGVSDRSSHYHHPPLAPPSASLPSRTSTPNTHFGLRSEPAEDGEVREDASASSSRLPSSAAILATTVPIRRPRRERPGHSHFDELHRKYYEIGRAFKFSGDARFWSTYPANHKEYRPLPNPPPPNSPYHKNGGLIARLELVDALVCFTYSIWSKEYGRRACIPETWQTAQAFLSWCKAKWDTQDTIGDHEIAFLGLIYMIEGFIHARKFSYASRIARNDTTDLWMNTKEFMFAAAREQALNATSSLLSAGSHLTPQGLPSPANSVPTNSAHSTPTNIVDRAHDHTSVIPSTSVRPPPQGSPSGHTQTLPPIPPEFLKDDFPRAPNGDKPTEQMLIAASKVTMSVSPHFINAVQSESQGIEAAQFCLERSQQTLTLPKMAQHFPTTFARMVHSNLAADEEYQPDMEDEEGELFWPGQCVTGEGLGWVCLMGKAMINELGKDIGYVGLKGVIPKPKADAPSGSMRGQPLTR